MEAPESREGSAVRPSQVVPFLANAFKHGRQVLLVGRPGAGKTDMGFQATDSVGFGLLLSHPAVSDPTDYKGLPHDAKDHAEFLPFAELWEAMKSTKPTVFFVDDLGQAPDSVQKAMMQLLHGRRLNGHRLPDHVVFLGATNDIGQRAGVTGILEPVKSRWDTIIHVETHIDDWCQWAVKNNMPIVLVAFLRTRPELLDKFEPTRELVNTPCPRTWAKLGQWVNDGISDYEVLAGCVGKGPATEFLAFVKLATKAPSLDAIILNPDTAPLPDADEPSLKYLVATGLSRKATKGNFERITKYLYRMEQPFRVMCMKDTVARDSDLTKTPAFVSWACDEGKEFI